jgi:hypothetical protein
MPASIPGPGGPDGGATGAGPGIADGGAARGDGAATPVTTGGLPRFAEQPDAGAGSLLTCVAHLYGQPLPGLGTMHALDGVEVVNPGPAAADVVVTAQLQGYSAPVSTALRLGPQGRATTPPLDLTFDFEALYGLSAPVTANETLVLAAAGNPAALDARTRSLTILPKNTIFWGVPGSNGRVTDTRFLISVFVTPHDREHAVDKLLKEAASHSLFGAMHGYQYLGYVGQGGSWTKSVAPGYCSTVTAAMRAGEVFGYDITIDAGAGGDAYFAVYTKADWEGTGSSPAVFVDALGSWEGTFSANAAGTYVFAACVRGSGGTSRTLRWSLSPRFTPVVGAFDQLAAIFLALQARGMQYVNVPQDFFLGAQNVRYPAESLATASANCIDGSLVFASALEAMGMRPGIVMVPGHAFVAVLPDPDADPCQVDNWLPIETTMIAGATPLEAVEADLARHMPGVKAVFASQCPVPATGEPMIVDVHSLRTVGLKPAPM